MVLLCVNLLRRTRFCSLPAHLIRNLRVCKQVGHILKEPFTVSSQISCHRTTNSVHIRATRTGPPLLFCSNGRRTDCFQIGPQTTSGLHSTKSGDIIRPVPVQTQCGHHFHTSAPVRALPAPVLWLVLKPLQKLMAIILGRQELYSVASLLYKCLIGIDYFQVQIVTQAN